MINYNCHKTMPGWAENIIGSDNACFVGVKQDSDATLNFDSNELLLEKNQNTNFMQRPKGKLSAQLAAQKLAENFKIDQDLVDRINSIPSHQNTWTAEVYENLWHENMSILQAKKFGGNFVADRKILKSQVSQHSEDYAQSPFQGAYLVQEHADKIVPDSWDWRDVNGENFVSPVRHQDMCGSCYIFASAAELEARIRITTHNQRQPILSTQQVVDCSPYSQGCAGGFPYLIAGKWAAEYGFIDESCYPYEGKDNVCRDPELEQYMSSEDVQNTNQNGGFYSAKSNENGDACYKNRYYSWMYWTG